MPVLLNNWRQETHTEGSGNVSPSAYSISSAANRLLVCAIHWSRFVGAGTQTSTPTLTYGGQTMSRQVHKVSNDPNLWSTGIALFTLTEAGIAAAGSAGFGLSWSDFVPETHGNWAGAYRSVASYQISGHATNSAEGTAVYWNAVTTSHSRINSATIIGITHVRDNSSNDVFTWQTNPSATISSLASGTFGTSGNRRMPSGVAGMSETSSASTGRSITAVQSSVYLQRVLISLRMDEPSGPPPSSLWIARGAVAADAWTTKETTFRLELGATANDTLAFAAKETTRLPDNTQASDAWDSVYFTSGVNSCQFFCHVQNSSKQWINITDDVSAVNIFRKSGDLFNNIRPGEAYFVLNNASGKYNQERTDKEIDIVPTAEIRIFATYLVNTHHLFTGTIESFNVNPDLSQRYFTIKAKDQIKKAQSITVTTSLFSNYQVNSYIGDLIRKIGISPSSVDAISNTIPVAWADRRVGLNVIEDIAEAGAYTAYVDGHGVFNFRNRNFELAEGNKLSADEFFALSYSKDDSMVWNKISVGGERRQVTTDVHTLTYITEPIYIGPGSTKNFFLSYIDYQTRDPVPATGIVTPVTSQDIMLFETQSATGTDFTSTASWWLDEFAESSKCYIYNGSASEAWLTKFQIRGRPARKQPAIKVEKEVASSQAIYGVQEIDIDNKWIQDDDYASDYVDFLKQRYEDAEPKLKMTLRHDSVSNYSDPEDNFDAARIELGDLITVTNSYLGFNTKGFVVKELEHDITVDRGVIHDLTLHLDRPTWDESVIIFKLDDPVLGVLNGSGQLVF